MPFKADVVEALAYDFRPFAEIYGVSPEPSPDQIKTYFTEYGDLMRKQRRVIQEFDDRSERARKNEDREAERAVDDEYARWQDDNADHLRNRRIDLLADLLSQQPTGDQLRSLPGRLFNLYEESVQEDMSPKAKTADTSD